MGAIVGGIAAVNLVVLAGVERGVGGGDLRPTALFLVHRGPAGGRSARGRGASAVREARSRLEMRGGPDLAGPPLLEHHC